MRTDELKEKIQGVLQSGLEPEESLRKVCHLLRDEREGYDWVGFYLVDRNSQRELVLGPFAGEPTDHTRIGFGQGICGQAADTLKVFVIDDVSAESNYLSCSPSVRSEFVAPVMAGNVLVGELDLDSHKKAAFGKDDAELLKWTAEAAAQAVARAAGFEL